MELVVEIKESVETYPAEPNPCRVEFKDNVDTYPADPNPWIVEFIPPGPKAVEKEESDT